MELIKKLQDPEIVVKFQQVCGIHRLPVCEGGDSDENIIENLTESDNYDHDKYFKQNNKYMLIQDSYGSNSKKSTTNSNGYTTGYTGSNIRKTAASPNGYSKPGIMPVFSSEDSDSDSNIREGRPRPTPHVIRNKFFYYIFKFASLGGEEAFYLTFLPFWMWNVDCYVARHTVLVWGLTMYLGQAIKDVLRWPRPSAPPVVRLETDYTEEYSMPSTHAVAGTTIPFMICYTMFYRYQIPASLAIGVFCCWSVMVCLSRLYLGVHTVLDLIGGILLGSAVICVFVPFIDHIDWFLQTNPFGVAIVFLLCFLLTLCYPNPVNKHGNNTKSDAVQIIASVTGCFIGTWMNYFNGMSYIVPRSELIIIAVPTLKEVVSAILRFIVGGMTLILIKAVVKSVSVKCISHVIGLEKPDSYNFTVKIWYRFITYMSLGVVITWTAPIFHQRFGLARPGFYGEVL